MRGIVKPENINYPSKSMWREIEYYGLPTRLYRWCCGIFKEKGGVGRFCMTGVRWAESNKRKDRGSVEVVTPKKKDKIILNADNDESRRLMENCITKGIRTLNPIVDWSDADVWELLHYYGCDSNPLYQCGFARVGCIGCPNAAKQRENHWRMWPKYKESYLRAAQRYVDKHPDGQFKSGEELFNWWMNDKNLDRQIDGQIKMDW